MNTRQITLTVGQDTREVEITQVGYSWEYRGWILCRTAKGRHYYPRFGELVQITSQPGQPLTGVIDRLPLRQGRVGIAVGFCEAPVERQARYCPLL